MRREILTAVRQLVVSEAQLLQAKSTYDQAQEYILVLIIINTNKNVVFCFF